MYGCETWTLTLKEENKLLVAERKILRKILGPTIGEDGEWRQRYNREIENIVSEPNIIGEIKSSRLRWLGHVERMGEDRAVSKVYLGQPSGRRPVGRPRYHWKNEVAKDLKELEVSDWSELAQNREDWRTLMSEAKIHFGSLSQRSKITQSEQERSCIALLRLQRRCGQFLWVHAVLQLKENLENSQRPVVVCTNQVLSEDEAAVMKANPWLYHYYAVQSKLHYGLAYEAATRMYGPPPPDIQVYPPPMQYAPTPPLCINGGQPMIMPNAGLQPHIPHVPPHLAPMHYSYERPETGPVDYSVSLQDNRYPNIRIEDTRIQPNAKRKAKNPDSKPNTPITNMSPRCTPSTITSGGDTLVAVAATSIASRRPGSKSFNITETELIDQWNPSPTWSESALQKVPDVCQQDLSPYVTTTPPTPSGTPSAYTHNYSHTFVFDWSPEQYVPHTNNRCNTVTTESSYQQTWNRSPRTFANSSENSLDENCNPNRLSNIPLRVSNPPPAYNANRESEVLRRPMDRPHPDSPDAKKPAL
ncbi:unnamed protein product [Plutella xylostella]|uniref:(diamondback moth) hypothetical protein n=1 Tax=Plutella xylostella TaxID=51655 RepID=A0A8S4EBN6_PLUXY|nr:unnamed protein product [Plutella xylostella]